ncbi:hypothetical protein JCM11251_002320 [Rhodosporidiobolus azoricus]
MDSTSASPVKANGTTSARVDKATLLKALADELKRERQRAQDWAQKMVEAESQVEQKHRDFLEEEARLSAQRDANAATISSLRKELARAKQALEEASHVDEQEAQAYLALLSNGTSNGGVPSSPTRHDRPVSSGLNGDASLTGNGGIYSTSRISSTDVLPSSAYFAPDCPQGSTSLSHQPGSPYSSPPLQYAAGHVPLERSVWHDSIDEPRFEGVQPELAKSGRRWSRVFPSLKRRNSEVGRA